MRVSIILIGLALMLGLPTNVQAGDKAVKCGADKVRETAKYSACLLQAESRAIRKGLVPDFSKCDSKFSQKWQKAETKAEGACLTNGDEAVIQAQVQQFMDDVLVALCLRGELGAGLACCEVFGGKVVGGTCWFINLQSGSCNPCWSCDQVCSDAGLSYDPATETYAGSGGTLANCDAVLTALFSSLDPPSDASCSDGIGCAFSFSTGNPPLRCTDPPTTSSAASDNLFRACACR